MKMSNYFLITWTKKSDKGKMIRHNKIAPNLENNPKAALDIFCNYFGDLKENDIISIQEYKNGVPKGEPIVPADSSYIIPNKRTLKNK